jgi:hypothetical protein
MKTWRIALILLLLMLVLIIPVYAQETTPAAEATTEVTVEATEAAAVEATAEATAASALEPTAATTAEALPETTPIAGVAAEVNDDELQGASLLVLLVGLGAIGLVAFGTLVRSGFKPPQD